MKTPEWSPFITMYPNNQAPETKYTHRRVVEPSSKIKSKIDFVEDWQERADKAIEAYKNTTESRISPGQVYDFYV